MGTVLAGAAMVLLWTGCTCEPIYPPEAGGSCEEVGEKECGYDVDASESQVLLVCVDTLRWAVESACDDFGMLCNQIDGEPLCVTRSCEEGETRCTTDYSELIVCDEYGNWEAGEACGEGRQCAVRENAASCVDASCTEGETRCAEEGEAIETCDDAGGWVVTEVCPTDQVCELGTFVPTCVEGPTCSEENELEQRCNPEDVVWIQECQSTAGGADPMYDWVNTLDCSTLTPDYICQQEGDEAPFCLPAPL
jgi:hypothetical protein